tara:strand:- start:358 stop:465 length:108 start_codon:yes stop_codon:yes gene_type:complete
MSVAIHISPIKGTFVERGPYFAEYGQDTKLVEENL